MKLKDKLLLSTAVLIVLVLLAMWGMEQRRSTRYRIHLRDTREQLEESQALRQGLSEANAELRNRLESMRTSSPVFAGEVAMPDPVDFGFEDWELYPDEEDVPEDDALTSSRPDRVLSEEEAAELREQEEERARRAAERQERREAFQGRMREELHTRYDFFSRIPMDGLSEEYRENQARLLQTMTEIDELMDSVFDPSLNREERREQSRTLWRMSRQLHQQLQVQKDVLLNDYAEFRLGLEPEQTQEFIEYMRVVNEMSSGTLGRGGPPAGRGWNR